MVFEKSGYTVGKTFFWYGKALKIKSIQAKTAYDKFGQPHVLVRADDGKIYWLRA